MISDYYRLNDKDEFSFYKFPKALFNERYKDISNESKLLYTLLYDRLSLSNKNGWYDHSYRLYIYFTIKEVIQRLNIGHDKAIRLFKELEKAHLIKRKRQGQGKPSIIYIKRLEV